MGAVKANIGHSEAAAGVVSLIKTILMLQRHQIPPQPGYPFTLNHKFPQLDDANIRVADGRSQLIPWSDGDGKRKLMINGFDAAGGNTSMLIEDPPPQSSKQTDPRTHHVILCSARTASSLAANKGRLQRYLMETPEINLADLSYTTTARRLHEVCRDAYVVDSAEELINQLGTSAGEKQPPSKSTGSPLIFAFTGQSSQYTGMGATLYQSSPRFRRNLDSYEALCAHEGLASFIGIIRGTQDVASSTTAQLQLAIVALEIGLARYWQSLGLQPGLVIGHSLGEYAALCIAGVLSISDTLFLVHERAALMQDRCMGSYSMLAAPLGADSIQELLSAKGRSSCEISCFNGPSMTVVSGVSQELESLQAELKSMKLNPTRLNVQFGFHSPQMEPILDEFESVANRVHFGQPMVPVASTLTGTVVTSRGVFNAEYLTRQMRHPVDFLGAVRTSEAEGLIQTGSVVFEIGPHPVCLGLIASCLGEARPTSFGSLSRGQDDWKAVSTCLAGAQQARLPVDWQEFHKDYLDCVRHIDLPNYAFDLKNYWNSYQRQGDAEPETRPPPKIISDFSTTCLQKVESLHVEDGKLFATFISHASEPDLFRAIQGHIVDGVAICPAAVFADMAYTATRFLLQQSGVTTYSLVLELVDLDMTQALVVSRKDPDQMIQVAATMDEIKASVSIRFSSTNASSSAEHGACRVLVENEESSWESEWSRMQRLVRNRVDSLVESSTTGLTHRMKRALVYKLFASLVEYERPYQALQDVYIDESFEEATAHMTLDQANGLGSFTYSPYAVDALVHLAGFILNGNLAKPYDDLHIANHIGSMRILGELQRDRQLTCYTAIRERTSQGVTVCDVYVFDGASLVAICTGIRFQRLTRAIFGMLTGKDSLAVAGIISEAKSSPRNSRRPVQESDSASSDDGRTSSTSGLQGSFASSQTSIDTPGLFEILIEVVAARTGMSVEEMHPSYRFADIGVDSPMSIAILTDFKKRAGVELPVAFFSSFPTVAEVERELGNADVPVQPHVKTQVHAPAKPRTSKPSGPKPQAQPSRGNDVTRLGDRLLQIVATELGIGQDELTPSTDFASAGVDSILSIKILSAFKKETGTELPAAFFNSNDTVAKVREELDGDTSAPQQKENLPSPSSPSGRTANAMRLTKSPVKAPQKPSIAVVAGARRAPSALMKPVQKPLGNKKSVTPAPSPQPPKPEPESRAILIQGKARSTEAPLFLATDGSGAVAAYIHMPPLPQGRRIYALESPFLEVPEDYTLTVQEISDVFIKSIRKIQPHGPYLIGGWSAGSIYAYEISYRLTLMGEKITGLIIMDMRVPHSVPDAEVVTMAFVEKTGAFTGVNRASNFLHGLSEKQKMHLTSTVRALIKYDPIPFANEDRPCQTHLIWATKGLNESSDPNERDERITGPAAMGPAGSDKPLSSMSMEEFEIELKSWFFAKRYDFDTNGWEDFVGDNIAVHKVEAGTSSLCNTFDILQPS